MWKTGQLDLGLDPLTSTTAMFNQASIRFSITYRLIFVSSSTWATCQPTFLFNILCANFSQKSFFDKNKTWCRTTSRHVTLTSSIELKQHSAFSFLFCPNVWRIHIYLPFYSQLSIVFENLWFGKGIFTIYNLTVGMGTGGHKPCINHDKGSLNSLKLQ